MKPVLEQIALDHMRSISAFSYRRKHFEMPWHFHPQHELTYIEESNGTKFIGDFVGPYLPGELVLLRSNLPHCWKNYSQGEGVSKSIVVQWNKGIFAKAPELEAVFTMLRTASRGIIFNRDQSKPLISSFRKLLTLEGHDLYVQLLVLLVELSKCNYHTLSEASFTDDLPEEYGNRMAKIHDFVATNFNRKIYLRELSEIVNMSEQSFSRFFTKMMGRPFFTFLNEYRTNIAARMLIDSDDSVSQIGFACGYESPPFFFKKFNEAYGISPAKYRRKHMGKG